MPPATFARTTGAQPRMMHLHHHRHTQKSVRQPTDLNALDLTHRKRADLFHAENHNRVVRLQSGASRGRRVRSGPLEHSHPKGAPYEKTAVNFLRDRANDVPALTCSGHYEAERNEAGHRESLEGVHE